MRLAGSPYSKCQASVSNSKKTSECNYYTKQQSHSDSQKIYTCRELQRCFVEQDIPMGKIGCQQKYCLMHTERENQVWIIRKVRAAA